jgi:hypothetical protein
MTATDFVDKDDEDTEWEVDFEYVVRGFLSYRVPYVLGYMKFEELELSAKVVRNFLNYVSSISSPIAYYVYWKQGRTNKV